MKTSIASIILLFFSGKAIAQGGVIIFGVANATAIPTVSGTMLMVLSILTFIIGYIMIKNDKIRNSHKMIFSLITVGVISFGYGGIKLINVAYAGVTVIPTVKVGEIVINYDSTGNSTWYENQSSPGVPHVIIAVNVNADSSACDGGALPADNVANIPTCEVGLVIQPGAHCFLKCVNPNPP